MALDRRLEIEIGKLRERLEKVDPASIGRSVEIGLREALLYMQRDVQANKLSGQYLGIVTGQARRSIQYRTSRTRDVVRGVIGSPFRYVRAHEEGFRGTVAVRAFTRSQRGKRVNVRPHSRRVNMRARRFLRDTMNENIGRTRIRVIRAIRLLLRTGRPPTQAEVR